MCCHRSLTWLSLVIIILWACCLLWHKGSFGKGSVEEQIWTIQSRIVNANFSALYKAAVKDVQAAIKAKDLSTSLFFQWTNDLLRARGKPCTNRSGPGIDAATMVHDRLIEIIFPNSPTSSRTSCRSKIEYRRRKGEPFCEAIQRMSPGIICLAPPGISDEK